MTRLLICIFLCSAFMAKADTPVPSKKKAEAPKVSYDDVVKKYSYEQMQNVAGYLSVIIEGSLGANGQKPQKILKCDPSAKRAQELLSGEMHALVDATKEKAVAEYKKDPATFAARIKSCSERCACSSYGLLFEDIEEPLATSQAHQANKTALDLEAKKETPTQSLKCAQKLTW